MLHELVVEDYAVVDRLRVRFHAGLNLLTGETGSGKSIVVDALGLLLGGRASTDMIRSGKERARVSGVFEIGASGGQGAGAGRVRYGRHANCCSIARFRRTARAAFMSITAWRPSRC